MFKKLNNATASVTDATELATNVKQVIDKIRYEDADNQTSYVTTETHFIRRSSSQDCMVGEDENNLGIATGENEK